MERIWGHEEQANVLSKVPSVLSLDLYDFIKSPSIVQSVVNVVLNSQSLQLYPYSYLYVIFCTLYCSRYHIWIRNVLSIEKILRLKYLNKFFNIYAGQQSTAKDHQNKTLQNKVSEPELRITAGEKYSSKDCLIMENMPVKDPMFPLSHHVCDFLKYILNFGTDTCNFKACHYLWKFQSQLFVPANFVKFVYFHEKPKILGRKSWLAGKST